MVLCFLCTTGKKHLEKAVQHCLALLNLTLQKENLFMDLLRESHLSLIVTPLEQLLQGINPRTKKADHVVNIARCVQRIDEGGALEAQKCLSPDPFISFISQCFSFHFELLFLVGGGIITAGVICVLSHARLRSAFIVFFLIFFPHGFFIALCALIALDIIFSL